MRISLIVAVAENGVIGCQGKLPWRLAADLRRFKNITMGHTLIMGRRTFQSIGRALPGRRCLVVSRNREFVAEGCEVVRSFEDGCEAARGAGELFVIGGRLLYECALDVAAQMFWTQVHATVDGDTYFPSVDWSKWKLAYDEPHPADDKNDYPFNFRLYQRP
jgi:dihydrofolate reductase